MRKYLTTTTAADLHKGSKHGRKWSYISWSIPESLCGDKDAESETEEWVMEGSGEEHSAQNGVYTQEPHGD